MTYLVLARKWRPRSFDTLVGQDHVVRALTHALDTQRLHHAWLFTGTRGVGKTTLSRILAKSLNCDTGITSKPCGVCRACTEIDSGRFVDYLELDAASNRGVDEMTQLLEQAVYSPGAGRFKVYMIDEVHMLTGHAFNAMLKTLEEPPPHVKFILATTDPQKIPVTVLSRCLQFNLKQMPPDSIVGHLRYVLGEEQMAFDTPALRLIAQAASGSMRDALSLTDQAIAYSAGNLTEEAVRGMLGTIDQRHLVRLLEALAAGDARSVLAVADELATRGLSYSGALADLAVLLSRIAIEQRVSGVTAADDPLAGDIGRLAQALHADAVQLFYSVAVHSRGELALAPDEYAGFVMACLRMLSLSGDAGPQTLPVAQTPAAATTTPATAQAMPAAATSAAVAAPAVAAASVAMAAVPTPAPAMTAAADPISSSAQESAAAASAGSHAPSAAASKPLPAPVSMPAPAAVPMAAPSSGPVPGAAVHSAAPVVAAVPFPAPAVISASVPPWEDAPAVAAAPLRPAGLESASNNVPAPGRTPGQAGAASAAIAPSVSAPGPASASVPIPVATVSAVAAETPAVAARPVAADSADSAEPPSWVDESIPDEAAGGYMPESEYTANPDDDDDFETLSTGAAPSLPSPPASRPRQPRAARPAGSRGPRLADMSAATWPALAATLPVTGLAAEVARQSEWMGVQGDTVMLRLAVKTLADSASKLRLQTVLCEHFGQGIRLEVEVGATGDATAHAVAQHERAARQQAAEDAVVADPFVQALLADFGGRIVPGSIRAVDPTRAAA